MRDIRSHRRTQKRSCMRTLGSAGGERRCERVRPDVPAGPNRRLAVHAPPATLRLAVHAPWLAVRRAANTCYRCRCVRTGWAGMQRCDLYRLTVAYRVTAARDVDDERPRAAESARALRIERAFDSSGAKH